MEYTAYVTDETGREIVKVSITSEGATMRVIDAMMGAVKENMSAPRIVGPDFTERPLL